MPKLPLVEKRDIKLFLLYLLKNIGIPVDFETLNDIIDKDAIINYFDFSQSLAELLETGNVIESTENSETVYSITEQGIHVCENLESSLLLSLRERSLKSALRILDFKKRDASVDCTCEPEGNGYRLYFSITEKGVDTIRLAIRLNSAEQAEKIQYNCRNKPEFLYKGILALLSGEVDYLLQ